MAIHEILCALRNQMEITPEEAAKKIGIKVSLLNRIEKEGIQITDEETRNKIHKYIDYLGQSYTP